MKNVVIGLSTMYRSDWEAYSDGEKLNVFPLFGTFIGIEIPPGKANINLNYNPIFGKFLMYFSFITSIFVLSAFVFSYVKEAQFKSRSSLSI